MDERTAVLRAIIEAPNDDVPRLVYADWLEENGDADRAAFIRMQIEQYNRQVTTTLEPTAAISIYGDWDDDRLESAINEIEADHGMQWQEEMCPGWRLYSGFERGFVRAVYIDHTFTEEEMIAEIERFTRETPGRSVVVNRYISRAMWQEVIDRGILARICGIEVRINQFASVEDFLWLVGQLPTSTEELNATGFGFTLSIDQLNHLAELISQSGIRRLTLNNCSINDEGLMAFLNHPQPNLDYLDLRWNEIDDRGVRAISQSMNLPALRSLHLNGNLLGDPGVIALLDSPLMLRLIALDLAGCIAVSENLAWRLEQDRDWGVLRRLGLRNTGISESRQSRIQEFIDYHHRRKPEKRNIPRLNQQMGRPYSIRFHPPRHENEDVEENLREEAENDALGMNAIQPGGVAGEVNRSYVAIGPIAKALLHFASVIVVIMCVIPGIHSIVSAVYEKGTITIPSSNQWIMSQFMLVGFMMLGAWCIGWLPIEHDRSDLNRVITIVVIGGVSFAWISLFLAKCERSIGIMLVAGWLVESALISMGLVWSQSQRRQPRTNFGWRCIMHIASSTFMILILLPFIHNHDSLMIVIAAAYSWSIIRVLVGKWSTNWDTPELNHQTPHRWLPDLTMMSSGFTIMLISTFIGVNREEWKITLNSWLKVSIVATFGSSLIIRRMWVEPNRLNEIGTLLSAAHARRARRYAQPLAVMLIVMLMVAWVVR